MPYFHHFLSESLTYNNKLSTSTNSLIKPIKRGYLLHYKKRLFGKGWRQEFVVLYEDSSLVWMRDQHRLEVEGRIVLREAPDLIAASQWVSRVPHQPEPPFGCKLSHAIAIGSKHENKVEWFICKSFEDLTDWMTNINSTLPPPPPPPLEELKRLEHQGDKSQFRCHKSEDSTLYSLSSTFNRSVALLDHEENSSSSNYEKIYFSSEESKAAKCKRGSNIKRKKSTSCRELSGAVPPSSHEGVKPICSGLLLGGLIAGTHWSLSDWGWGMGWGWNLCDDCCALQQQDMVHPPPVFTGVPSELVRRAELCEEFIESENKDIPQFVFGCDDCDDDDDADVACDFGGDFGGF